MHENPFRRETVWTETQNGPNPSTPKPIVKGV